MMSSHAHTYTLALTSLKEHLPKKEGLLSFLIRKLCRKYKNVQIRGYAKKKNTEDD